MHSDALSAPPSPGPKRGTLKIVGIAALLLAGAAVAYGIVSRSAQTRDTQRWSGREAIPTVATTRPTATTGGGVLSLPGDLAAENAAQIYARVGGYLRTWNQDIGAHVGAGQLLATLDTPELDQQVAQARATLISAQAMQRLSASTAKRWTDLLASDAVSKQEADEKTGDLAAKTALVAADQANLNRLLALRAFARITAPFSGVVTARNANIGDLVNAGAGAQPLFVVSDIHKIRAYVRVPQSASADLHPGMPAQLKLPEYPGRTFPATVVSSSNAINPQSGTLLTELAADNPGGALKPGAFVTVDFQLSGAQPVIRLPASALIFRKAGLQIATLDASEHVHMRPITVARDLGPQVEVASGLTGSERVVDNPPDSLTDGELVRVAPARG